MPAPSTPSLCVLQIYVTSFNTPDSFVQFSFSSVFCSTPYCLIPVVETFPKYLLGLTWSSTETSVPNVLSVFHLWVNVSPWSSSLYLVSKLPEALPVSVLEEPIAVNSCQEHSIMESQSSLSWKGPRSTIESNSYVNGPEIEPTTLALLAPCSNQLS